MSGPQVTDVSANLTTGGPTPTQATRQVPAGRAPHGLRQRMPRWMATLFDKRFGGLWVLAGEIVLFSLLTPQTFLTGLTLQTTLSDEAITALMALAFVLPMVAGVLDLSIASMAGFAMVLCSCLSAYRGFADYQAIAATLACCLALACITGVLVTRLSMSSFITTLGMSSAILGLTELLDGGQIVTPRFSAPFYSFGRSTLGVIPLPFVYVLVTALVMYYVLEHTPFGRRLRAAGANPEAARLVGIRVKRVHFRMLVLAGVVAAFAGLVLASSIGVATDTTAPPYLFPALTSVFLGASLIKEGPNVWGTVLGVLIVGTGIKGLELIGADPWVIDFFNGAVLLMAIAISGGGIKRLS